MQQVEQKLDELFVKKAPFQLPVKAKETLVRVLPWLTLIGGILSAIAVFGLFQLVMVAQQVSNITNTLSVAYGNVPAATTLSPMIWVGVIIMALEAVLFFIAFAPLKAHKKSGWNLLYYVAVANVAYAIVYLFINWSIVSLLFSLLSSTIGLYLLFQIRSYYTGAAYGSKSSSGASTEK